jgi:F-type H+-transporting ATPase subunit delta
LIRQSIARRYAKGLFAVGDKDGKYGSYSAELEQVMSAVEANQKLKNALMLPLLEMDKRRDLLSDVIRVLAISPTVANLLYLLLENHRIDYLPFIRNIFSELVDEREGRTKGQIFSPYPLSDDMRSRIETVLSERLGKKVQLSLVEDENLIGGVKVIIGGLRIDGSVRHQLELMNESMLKE